MKFMELLPTDSAYLTSLIKKLAAPLGKRFHFHIRWSLMFTIFFSVTLLSAEPELQFVALRNINLIVQKR